MNLVPGICTQCGATLSVDKEKDAMVCPYCDTPFVVEKAIVNFTGAYNIVNNIAAENVYFQSDKKDFEIEAGILKKYVGENRDVVVPSSVSAIGQKAFEHMNIRNVKLSEGVEAIYGSAFQFSKMSNIELPSSLSKIVYRAFWGCSELKEITIPSNVNHIGENAFGYCFNLETIVFEKHPSDIRIEADVFKETPRLVNIVVQGKKLDPDNPLVSRFFVGTGLSKINRPKASNSKFMFWKRR